MTAESRLNPEQEEQLIQEAFKPHTLVHGVDNYWVMSTLRDGITPGDNGGVHRLGICTSMLDESQSVGERYSWARNYAPRNDDDKSIGILIDPEKAEEAFPRRVIAIGNFFSTLSVGGVADDMGREYHFTLDAGNNSIHGLPIYNILDERRWSDEVRIYDGDLMRKLTPDYWKGIVVGKNRFQQLLQDASESSFRLAIPVFSPPHIMGNPKVLAADLGALIRS